MIKPHITGFYQCAGVEAPTRRRAAVRQPLKRKGIIAVAIKNKPGTINRSRFAREKAA